MVEIRLRSLSEGTREEYDYLESLDHALNRGLGGDLLALFAATDRETGYPLSPMRHALQTATRAFRDRADEETVFAALFHDIADRISPANHARVGAELLRPYVGERTYWILSHHAVFQGYFFWHHIGRDRHAREQYRGHPHFEACAAFCEKWDQVSFDPDYDTMPLAAFLPIVHRVLGREPFALSKTAAATEPKR
jgi:predicted HD phosphohydrolase